MLRVILLNDIMLNVILLNVIVLNAIMPNAVILNVNILNVVMLNVIILNVIMPNVMEPFERGLTFPLQTSCPILTLLCLFYSLFVFPWLLTLNWIKMFLLGQV